MSGETKTIERRIQDTADLYAHLRASIPGCTSEGCVRGELRVWDSRKGEYNNVPITALPVQAAFFNGTEDSIVERGQTAGSPAEFEARKALFDALDRVSSALNDVHTAHREYTKQVLHSLVALSQGQGAKE